jgi:transposase InsO family protein
LAAETNRRVLSLAADAPARSRWVAVLDDLVLNRGKPKILRSITARYLNGVQFDFSRSRAPTDNAFIEAFNARIRAEFPTPAVPSPWLTPGNGSRGGGSITTPNGLVCRDSSIVRVDGGRSTTQIPRGK